MVAPLVYADFNNLDGENRLKLTCAGTMEDLQRQALQMREGMPLTFYMDDADDAGQDDKLLVDGTVQYNQAESCWVAVVDWDRLRHESDFPIDAKTTTTREGAQRPLPF